jgi:hypothetical protein
MSEPRPAVVCRELLNALEASEGRRRRRKRDTTPDAIGLGVKRALLEAVVVADPDPTDFEGWLLARCLEPYEEASVGAMRAMALDVLNEWRLACLTDDFAAWLERGAPSDDVGDSDMAPHKPQRSSRPGEAGSRLDNKRC